MMAEAIPQKFFLKSEAPRTSPYNVEPQFGHKLKNTIMGISIMLAPNARSPRGAATVPASSPAVKVAEYKSVVSAPNISGAIALRLSTKVWLLPNNNNIKTKSNPTIPPQKQNFCTRAYHFMPTAMYINPTTQTLRQPTSNPVLVFENHTAASLAPRTPRIGVKNS